MEKDAIDKWIRDEITRTEVPVMQPKEGHERRFLAKLEASGKKKTKTIFWKPFAVAASFLVLFAAGFYTVSLTPAEEGLARVSPEMKETQNFFVTTINNELANIQKEVSPATEAVINDALKQLEILENEYEKLKVDLVKSANDKRVVYAMITNFQNRIALLENVLQQIEKIKELKSNHDETII
jgi:hypothetical protein